MSAPSTRRDDELATLMARVARARELDARAAPALAPVPRDVLVERALLRLEAGARPGSLDAETRWLRALELVPAELTGRAALRRALEASLWAFYDAERGEVVIDAALGGSARQRVLAHELAHALVDGHFGLAARLSDARATSDARAALHALAEGDAEAVVDALWPSAQHAPLALPAQSAGLDAPVPPIVQRSLSAAYADGTALVRRLRSHGGWRAVDAAYRDPPRGTLELSSPERAGAPAPVEPAALPEPGWRETFVDVLGAQTLRGVLEEWLPAAHAAELASDWAGDRLSVLEGPASEQALVWELRWRSGRAESAATALRRSLHPSATDRGQRSVPCRAHRDAGVLGQWWSGDRLWIVQLAGVPKRTGCVRLARWARALSGKPGRGGDPGPSRLIGPP